jgi:UDP-2,3-diacylglucosamine hydrolase
MTLLIALADETNGEFDNHAGTAILNFAMSTGNGHHTSRVAVVSDLHLFARRSQGNACLESLRRELASVQTLVLNGDIFDFRWSTVGDLDMSVSAAIAWLRDLSGKFPDCQFHYVLGNHDCLAGFKERLAALSVSAPRLRWHEHALRLDSVLFLHGDCADRPMDASGFCRYRARWENDRQRSAFAATAYLVADRLGITRFTQQRHFPQKQTVKRIVHYLDQTTPDWRQTVRHCYFGHTHLPFTGYPQDGVTFHNTGSAIRGMAFNPIFFDLHSSAATVARSG